MPSWNGHPLDGCLFEGAPAAAPRLDAPGVNANTLPRRIDLRGQCSPVENQGQTNSCTANAVVGALELHQRKAGLPATDLSRLFLYYNARALAHNEDKPVGSFIHHAMAAVLAFGVCEERMWPFQQAMALTRPTDACYQNATGYEAVQFARTPRGPAAMAALAQGLPVAFGIFVPMGCYDVAAKTGTMPMADELPTQQPPAGHAMLIVGYDLDEQVYIVRNSWGPGFADQGYLKIPFKVMDAYTPEDQFWTIGAIAQAPTLAMFGPSVKEAVDEVKKQAGPTKIDELRGALRGDFENRLAGAKVGFRDRLRS